MRRRGMMLSALGIGLWWGSQRLDREFRGLPGWFATKVSPKWRGRRNAVLASARLGRKAAIAGALWAAIPKKRKRIEQVDPE
jgi:hypothetical protein